MKLSTMENFNKMIPHLSVEQQTDMIGKRCVFKNAKLESHGQFGLFGVYEVIGLQKIYDGSIAYRVRCVEFQGEPYNDNFGRPMKFDEAKFI